MIETLISVDETGAGDLGQDTLRGPHEALLLRPVRRRRGPGKGYVLYIGPGKRMVPGLRESFRQGQAEVVSNSKNKILATWEPFFCRAL